MSEASVVGTADQAPTQTTIDFIRSLHRGWIPPYESDPRKTQRVHAQQGMTRSRAGKLHSKPSHAQRRR